jgi:hypothetical protein
MEKSSVKQNTALACGCGLRFSSSYSRFQSIFSVAFEGSVFVVISYFCKLFFSLFFFYHSQSVLIIIYLFIFIFGFAIKKF